MHPLILAAIIVGSVLAFFLLVYLILIAPSRPRVPKELSSVKYAHRGLHGDGKAENSLSAFRAARDAGFGIELDVRLSSDGVLMVFHDDTLDRVCGVSGRVDSFTAEELSKIKLSGTEDTVPTFAEVLSLVGGAVPILVEIKEDAGNSRVSTATAEMLEGYSGAYLVQSFNPMSLANFRKHSPLVLRGILSHRYYKEEKYRKPLYFLLQCLLFNRLCRPSFISYDHRDCGNLSLKLAQKLFGATTFAWTVRSQDEANLAKKHGFDTIIFEGFIPEK